MYYIYNEKKTVLIYNGVRLLYTRNIRLKTNYIMGLLKYLLQLCWVFINKY